MGKTLYITDLDGTLLDKRGYLTEYTKSVVRRMIDEGHLFTIATARSLQSAQQLIYFLGILIPVVLTNGSTIYDPVKEDYIEVKTIPLRSLSQILEILDRHNLCGFLHILRNNILSIYFRRLIHGWDRTYHAHRIESYQGRLYEHGDLLSVAQQDPAVFMVVYGELERLQALQQDLEHVSEIKTELYSDVYTGYYFIDIFPSTASKGNGMLKLQELTGADKLVAFGDNFNDLSMLVAADYAYVPKNGIHAAKNIATAVVDYAHKDGVAHFLSREMGWESAPWCEVPAENEVSK